MPNPITIGTLFNQHRQTLMLSWANGEEGVDKSIAPDAALSGDTAAPPWVGFLNVITPNRIQVIGAGELEYLGGLGKNSYTDTIERLFSTRPAAIIVSDDIDIPDDLKTRAAESHTPLLRSAVSSHKIVDHLRYHLTQLMSAQAVMHGVFLEVFDIGLLLTGPSGIGKSELALELVSRGHRLVADDAPSFMLAAPDVVVGRCPPALRDFIEVRGLGVLNIRAMFGDSAVKKTKQLRLVIHIEHLDAERLSTIDRLRGSHQTAEILGVQIPQITLPVAAGRNLAVLVETAVRNHLLVSRGYNAADDFLGKHDAALLAKSQ